VWPGQRGAIELAGWGDAGPAVAEWDAVVVVGVRLRVGRRGGSGALLEEPMGGAGQADPCTAGLPRATAVRQRSHGGRGDEVAGGVVEQLTGQHAGAGAVRAGGPAETGGYLHQTVEAAPRRPGAAAAPRRQRHHDGAGVPLGDLIRVEAEAA